MNSIEHLTKISNQINSVEPLIAERDDLIAQCREERYSWKEISEATGLTVTGARFGMERSRERGFEPRPFNS